jgi:hypothetical protein
MLRPGVIVEQINEMVAKADLVFCDLTFHNPNVFYELGVAHTLSKETLMISQTASAIPFDLSHRRVITYEDTKLGLLDLRERLVEALHIIAPIDTERQIPRTDAPRLSSDYKLDELEVQRSALYSHNIELIRYAVRYLGANKDDLSYGRIEQIAQTHYTPPDLVRDALVALSAINPAEALPILLDSAFRHVNYLVRERAVILMGNYDCETPLSGGWLGNENLTLLQLLHRKMSDESWGVRQTVCEVLGRWGDPRSMPVLQGGISDSAFEVSMAARSALARIREQQRSSGPEAAADAST